MNIRIPVSWLRDYLKTDLAAKTIAHYLTLCGPSVERIEKRDEDYIFEVEVTSNRPDAFSVFGLAREAHAILVANGQKSQLITPKGLNLNLEPDTSYQLPLDVIIKNHNLCPRFSAIILDHVKVKPSPANIKNRLVASGIRPINNIVDISNYLMLELGQPMHTFDYDKIKGAKMTLRTSVQGEKIKTIDGKMRKLPQGSIVIQDQEKLIDLCGIMGGQNSAVSSRTKRTLLFVQAYDPLTIHKTTQALAFRTEAAARFEKGIDTAAILPAISRAVYLAKQTAGARIASELVDIFPNPPKAKTLSVSLEKLTSYLGVSIESAEACKILDLLGFKTSKSSQAILAKVPAWRTADIEREEDLIEEIARIYGYHNLPSKLPQGSIPDTEESILTKVIELKKALKFLELTEVMTYSIISRELLTQTKVKESKAVELANPLTSEWQFMRPTLLISLAKVIADNQNPTSNLGIFEIAHTYLPRRQAGIKAENNLPQQHLQLAIALQTADFYQIKDLVENVFEVVSREPKLEQSTSNHSLFEKSQTAQIKVGGTVVGALGILTSDISDHFGLDSPITACEINLSTVYGLPSTVKAYHPIPKYPPIIEDISAIFDEKTPVAEITAQVKKIGDPLVKEVEIVDIYQDEKIGRKKKSVTLRLTYQKTTKTPSQEEVTRMHQVISRNLAQKLGATIRK